MPPADIGLGGFGGVGGGFAALQLGLVHARLQHAHGGGAIAVLAAIGLAGNDDAGGHMGDADRRFGLVDVLTTGTRGAIGVNAQV